MYRNVVLRGLIFLKQKKHRFSRSRKPIKRTNKGSKDEKILLQHFSPKKRREENTFLKKTLKTKKTLHRRGKLYYHYKQTSMASVLAYILETIERCRIT